MISIGDYLCIYDRGDWISLEVTDHGLLEGVRI